MDFEHAKKKVKEKLPSMFDIATCEEIETGWAFTFQKKGTILTMGSVLYVVVDKEDGELREVYISCWDVIDGVKIGDVYNNLKLSGNLPKPVK
jgi:hypothetical protein